MIIKGYSCSSGTASADYIVPVVKGFSYLFWFFFDTGQNRTPHCVTTIFVVFAGSLSFCHYRTFMVL